MGHTASFRTGNIPSEPRHHMGKGSRAQAAELPAGRDRDELLKKVRQAETAMHLEDWANSPGLQPPK